MNKFQELKQQLNAARKESRKGFGELFTGLFEKYPKLDSIGWTAYTPYFNDGEACTYSSHHDYDQYVNGESIDGYDIDDEDFPFTNQELDDIGRQVAKIVSEFDDDDLEYMFGEGLITVHKNGVVKIEHYDHD